MKTFHVVLLVTLLVPLALASPAAVTESPTKSSTTPAPTTQEPASSKPVVTAREGAGAVEENVKDSPDGKTLVAEVSDTIVGEIEAEVDLPQDRQQVLDPCEKGQGVCMNALECGFQRGQNIGNCNTGNVCCHIARTCEKGREVEISTNNTYFVEPQKVWEPEGSIHCGVRVRKMALFGDSICQMRLDFVNFNTVGPDPVSGQCNYDMLTIEGADANTRVHNICGLNDGQHVYVDVKHTDAIKLRMNIDYGRDPNRPRKWNIRVTQLPCRSPRLAPPGCLQYFEDYTGTVKSFNYDPKGLNETAYPLGLRYSMCFKRGPDSCRVFLKKAGPFGLGEVPQEVHTRTNALNELDSDCFNKATVTRTSVSKAYLTIDNIKYCGNTFQDEYRTEDNGVNVMSFVSPHHEAIRDEVPPKQPPGFKFLYRLLAC